ncbi:acyltransferase [Methylobacterium aquaticum]|uniref:acyltransferase n=1 Tax=Methylobacterium aquaticum TaxID=270351 RepID=UPI000AEF9CBE|nr:acyltransferase [Methylobacterium aquaticum]
MPIHVSMESPNNLVDIDAAFLDAGNGHISIAGENNVVRIARQRIAGTVFFSVAGGARIELGDDGILGTLSIHAVAEGAQIVIGRGLGINGMVQITSHERASIRIGNFCLFAPDVTIMASDVHKILDRKSGRRLNPALDVTIEDKVWIAPRAVVLRGAHIRSESVVGWGSVVNGSFPPNSLLAGMPAKVVRKNIRWEH